AGRKTDNEAHRPGGIGLRPRDARGRRQRGSARGELQKFPAGSFHGVCQKCGGAFASSIRVCAGEFGTTLAHLSVSSAKRRAKSAGEPGSGVLPSSAIRAFILGSAKAALSSRLSVSTISAGVPAGAAMPYHALAS